VTDDDSKEVDENAFASSSEESDAAKSQYSRQAQLLHPQGKAVLTHRGNHSGCGRKLTTRRKLKRNSGSRRRPNV
jgi:hypothetical protein